MKRIVKILSIFTGSLIIIIVGGILYFEWLAQHPCQPPEKPHIVPESAIWSGGCDGGNWIELVNIRPGSIRFRIYRDWDGELQIDADFMLPDSITSENDLHNNWSSKEFYYEVGLDSLNYILIRNDTSLLKLKIIYPAYGGYEWNIIQEKYNIPLQTD